MDYLRLYDKIMETLKSDQNGIEIFLEKCRNNTGIVLKSDQNGIEIYGMDNRDEIITAQLKSDQNGIEMPLQS